jgi:hypothetical protein
MPEDPNTPPSAPTSLLERIIRFCLEKKVIVFFDNLAACRLGYSGGTF